MRTIALILAGSAALMLAACGADSPEAGTAADDVGAQYTIDPATGEIRMTIRRETGEATLRSGARVPVSLPAGFSLFPGSRVVSNSLVTRPDGQGILITFETAAPAEAVIAHYRAEAEAAGFAIQLELAANGSVLVGGKRARDGASLSVTATTGTPATGQIIINTITGG